MKHVLFAILAGGLLGSASLSQPPETTSPNGAPTQQEQQVPASPSAAQPGTSQAPNAVPRIAPGSVIPVQLSKTLDAKKSKSGDEVTGQVTQDMKTNSGEVIIPKGAKVIGHVTEAQPRSKEQKESEIGIAFDHAVLKNGTEVQMPASIQAIIAPPNTSSASSSSGGYEQPNGPIGGTSPSSAGGRASGMGGNATPPPSPSMPSGGGTSADAKTGSGARPPINANTQGVIGISDLSLTSASNSTQGSLVSSEKNNVKLESGTLMLLHVNQ
jgi:hypothetical protein